MRPTKSEGFLGGGLLFVLGGGMPLFVLVASLASRAYSEGFLGRVPLFVLGGVVCGLVSMLTDCLGGIETGLELGAYPK